jgi:hypothetical protein
VVLKFKAFVKQIIECVLERLRLVEVINWTKNEEKMLI